MIREVPPAPIKGINEDDPCDITGLRDLRDDLSSLMGDLPDIPEEKNVPPIAIATFNAENLHKLNQ